MLKVSTAPPSWVASPPVQSHIPSPYGAASPPLPFGTGHETNITFLFFFVAFRNKVLNLFSNLKICLTYLFF
ncbi:hypothetical protein JHK82_035493 [Glycine max]|nr:hypothetical protein JHK82_035493 [Glycine max]